MTAAVHDADRYLAEVRAHLGALPTDDRDDLLDDLATHLRELAAEDDRPPAEVLGPPADFAAELLASAGVAPAEERRADVGALVRARMERWAAHPWARAVLAFLPELRPAWWVARGYVAVLALSLLLGGETVETLPVPKLFGSALVGLAATVAGVVASVRLGRRGAPRRWLTAIDVATVVVALVLVGTVRQRAMPDYVYYADPQPAAMDGRLTHPDGTPITNIWPYDGEGRLLDDVLLYDQSGRPITVGEAYDEVTGLPLETQPRLDANGAPVEHAYPLEQRVAAEGYELGHLREQARPPSVVVPPPSTTTTTTTPATTTTTTTPPKPEPDPATTVPPEPEPPTGPPG